MSKHTIRLTGERARGARLSASIYAKLLGILTEGAKRSVRLRVEGRSCSKGATPEWLERAADFDIVGELKAGSTIIEVETRSLWQAVPERFRQIDFTEDDEDSLDVNRSGLDFFEESLAEALAGQADSSLYDDGLLNIIEKFSDLEDDGIDAIQFQNGGVPVVVEKAGLETVRNLERSTPAPQRVMVAGILDAIRNHDRMFALILPGKKTIKGVAEDISASELARYFGKPALIHGKAFYRPSGSILRIEADQIEGPRENDLDVFGKEPWPLRGRALDLKSIDKAQGPRSGINAIIGQWPGDETDEELYEYLESLA